MAATPFSVSSPCEVKEEKDGAEMVKVVCRIRPAVLEREHNDDVIATVVDSRTVSLGLSLQFPSHVYSYDQVFGPGATQSDIYNYCLKGPLEDFFNGYNGTVIVYGQTGLGKSYTMMGPLTGIADGENANDGIIPRVSNQVFQKINSASSNIEFQVSISYYEIYLEEIRDLLIASSQLSQTKYNVTPKITIHEDKVEGVHLKGISNAFVSSAEEMQMVLSTGSRNRAVASTLMNEESSRSHAIFQIHLSQKDTSTGELKRLQLFLVDLAGLEKIGKTGALLHGLTIEETKRINQSLSALGNVINALTDGKSTHIPYRDSKLTRILQESLGGNSRTSLIINCAPTRYNEQETLSTLRFGSRAKSIKNHAQINTELSHHALKIKVEHLERVIEQNQKQIHRLEAELELTKGSRDVDIPITPKKSIQTSGENMNSSLGSGSKLNTNRQSRIPIPMSSPTVGKVRDRENYENELGRRDAKIRQLETKILEMKMANLTTAHEEELKLFQLEQTLQRLHTKLTDVETINVNLRKHLIASERHLEYRDARINRLKMMLNEQQVAAYRETRNFEAKLADMKDKVNVEDLPTTEDLKVSNTAARDTQRSERDALSECIEVCEHRTVEQFLNLPTQVHHGFLPKMGLNLRIVKPLRGGGSRGSLSLQRSLLLSEDGIGLSFSE